MYDSLAIIAGFALLYSLIAGGIDRTWITGPIVFTAFGLLIGPTGFDLLSFETDREGLKTLAELTLAMVLFSDAAGADLRVLRKTAWLPTRLLLIGLPLTIALGYFIASLINVQLSVFELALAATMLAPTDAALGQAVVTNKSVPNNVRQGLSVESGLNDGICVPVLLLFLALSQHVDHEGGAWGLALHLLAEEVGIGVLVGVVLTALAVQCLKFAAGKQWLTAIWNQVPVIALALTCFATAQALGGSGFIASFVGGLLFGGLLGEDRDKFLLAAEGAGGIFGLITWVIFGSAVVGQAVGFFEWRYVVYAALSLTVIRMLPVFLVLGGTGLNTESKLFIGWFGPRGLASIVFAVMVMDAEVENAGILALVVTCTVIMSILVHGVTANPWARAFGRRSGSGA